MNGADGVHATIRPPRRRGVHDTPRAATAMAPDMAESWTRPYAGDDSGRWRGVRYATMNDADGEHATINGADGVHATMRPPRRRGVHDTPRAATPMATDSRFRTAPMAPAARFAATAMATDMAESWTRPYAGDDSGQRRGVRYATMNDADGEHATINGADGVHATMRPPRRRGVHDTPRGPTAMAPTARRRATAMAPDMAESWTRPYAGVESWRRRWHRSRDSGRRRWHLRRENGPRRWHPRSDATPV